MSEFETSHYLHFREWPRTKYSLPKIGCFLVKLTEICFVVKQEVKMMRTQTSIWKEIKWPFSTLTIVHVQP